MSLALLLQSSSNAVQCLSKSCSGTSLLRMIRFLGKAGKTFDRGLPGLYSITPSLLPLYKQFAFPPFPPPRNGNDSVTFRRSSIIPGGRRSASWNSGEDRLLHWAIGKLRQPKFFSLKGPSFPTRVPIFCLILPPRVASHRPPSIISTL